MATIDVKVNIDDLRMALHDAEKRLQTAKADKKMNAKVCGERVKDIQEEVVDILEQLEQVGSEKK